ncbi:OmpA-OmpF porin, OOP family [Jannaschia faecimaris]|uniref:OmpA-OmpF porin, OOP family n=1 Tax=Jannaschia faecimaris TaxID=1244108 RepID=A0A1H3J3U9_9RHOB|nr:OmpA family protein [Jannaschia faecimaris]SDY34199.1 OmpA-OmpF porin, OOP family [Jannaschia faecimaris]
MKTLVVFLALGLPAQAANLTMPFPANQTFAETRPLSSHRIATEPFDGTLPSITAEGAVTRRIWQLTGAETTLQILAPLRAQLIEQGWEEVFECATRACGGFDFRFEIDVTPAPQMFVDLADYRYLAAQRGAAWTTLLVSRSGELSFVQTTTVDPDAEIAPLDPASDPVAPSDLPTPPNTSDVVQTLLEMGRAVLPDLDFRTGSTELAQDSYASLADLSDFMKENKTIRIALVGHTDAEGSAEGNMAISRRRAESARTLLTVKYGVAPGRVEIQGVGFFAPLTRNDTEAGRQTNRRVEAVIISTP